MKDKKNLKSLRLRKETISSLERFNIKGGAHDAEAAVELEASLLPCSQENSVNPPICSGTCCD